jgi:HSP20 family protein
MSAQREWDPLRELQTVQGRMNKLFESALARTDFEAHDEVDSWSPVADVYETPDRFVICLELPGLEQNQIDLRVDGHDLTVAGEREIHREHPGEQFHRVERSYGKFSRRFHLPSNVDRDAVQATYRDGVLRIALPRRGDQREQRIQVAIG